MSLSDAPPRRATPYWAIGAIALLGLVALGLHARLYWPFFSDDGLISLRYSQRFLEGLGLTWNDGERVEGYSNLLWVLGVAALGRLGLDLVDAARVLGLLGAGAVIVAIARALAPATGREALRVAPAVLVPALCGPIAAWAIGGLEQPLVAGLLAWALVLSYPLLTSGKQPHWALGVPFGLLCLTRPDGPIFVVCAVAAILLLRRSPDALAACARLAAPSVVLTLAQLAFRRAYYGEWVPNTALVKIALTPERLEAGLSYVTAGMWAFWPLLVLASALSAIAPPDARRRLVFLAFPLVAWTSYVVFIGGDIFPARRPLVPSLVILALMVAEGVRAAAQLSAARRRAVLAFTWAMLALLVVVQRRDGENYRAAQEMWEWEGQSIATALGAGFGDRKPLLATTAAGCLPYWSRLPSLDMLGLNDAYVPRHRPAAFGKGFLGHELGDSGYVLRRAPDLVIVGGPRGGAKGHFFADTQLLAEPEFQRHYTLAWFEGTTPYHVRSGVWVRRDSPRVGIVASADTLTIPGYLFNGDPTTTARLDADGRFAVTATADHPLKLASVTLPRGLWRVSGLPGRWSLVIGAPDDYPRLATSEAPTFDWPGGEAEWAIQPVGPSPVSVRAVSLTRLARP
jgi:hypothetical protein